MYIYFYHRTLSALPHDCLPTLQPGTRSRVCARFLARGDKTPRARQGGAPRAGDSSPRPYGDVCAEPLRLTLTLIRTLWGDQCLDAVAREGSRLIKLIWLLCLERLLS